MSRELRITPHEYAQRRDRVRAELERRGLAALVQFGALRNFYLIGFAHSTTERPIALVLMLLVALAFLVPIFNALWSRAQRRAGAAAG